MKQGRVLLRLKSRRGPKGAIIAVAATMLNAAYYVLRDHVDYRDLGTDYFDRIDRPRAARRHDSPLCHTDGTSPAYDASFLALSNRVTLPTHA